MVVRQDGELKRAVERLAAAHAFPLDKLFVVDGSSRSAHSTAFFAGLREKRIVLYDTLLKQTDEAEVLAILAHEMGHWKAGHLTRGLVLMLAVLFVQLALFGQFVHNETLYSSFGFAERPALVGLLLFFQVAFTPLFPLLSFALSALSRSHEFAADSFAAAGGHGEALQTGLVKVRAFV